LTQSREILIPSLRKRWCNHFAGADGRIQAWTFVPKEIVDKVLAGEIQECPLERSEDDENFRRAYQWMMESMDLAGIQGRKPGISPWWCWITVGDGHTKPTDRHSDDSTVLLELSLDPEDVLLSDFGMWHVPLNYWFNAEDEAEEAFERELEAVGLSIYRTKPLPEPHHSRVQQSWLKVFALDEVNGYTSPMDQKGIQGVFWNLRPEIIKGVTTPDVFIDD
jgi:hypothetical protein